MEKPGRSHFNRIGVFITLMLMLPAAIALAEDPRAVVTTALLTSGRSMGVGGGSRANSSVLGVCDVTKVTNDEIADAIASALDDLGLSLDPPTTNPYEVVAVGKEWRTRPAKVSMRDLADYNSHTEAPLAAQYPFYISYDASLLLRGRSLRFQTVTTLRKGVNANESVPYPGDFDPKFFHNTLQRKIFEEIARRGCSR